MWPAESVQEKLKKWVPEDQQDTYSKNNYYTKDITALNARVISINTESCDYHNMY